MSIYYQLENMLVAGFKSVDEFERYKELKKAYEEETFDFSFSIRELVSQLEIIIETKENDFPYLEETLKVEYRNLVDLLKSYDEDISQKYLWKLEHE